MTAIHGAVAKRQSMPGLLGENPGTIVAMRISESESNKRGDGMNRSVLDGRKLKASILVLASSAATPMAWAQAADAGESTVEDGAASVKNDSEILVTARRREERLQDIPSTVSAVTGEQLRQEGGRQLKDVAESVSGFTFEGFGGALPLVSMRGDSNRLGFTEPGTGFFVDGIYINRQTQLGIGPVDVARVEVLKGPQSTLYGKNTLAGAVNIITNDPTFHWTGYVEAGIGMGAHKDELIWHAEGAVSGPLVEDKIAFRLTASHQEREGYVVDRVNGFRGMGYDANSIRAKLLFNLSEDLTWKLTASYRHDNAPRFDVLGIGPLSTGAFQQAPGTGTVTFGPTIWDRGADLKSKSISKALMLISELSYDSAIGTITSLTGYQRTKTSGITDDGTEFPILTNAATDRNEAISQEFRLAGASEGFTWLGGVYYLHDDQKEFVQTIGFQSSSTTNMFANITRRVGDFPTNGETSAVYGQLGYDFSSSFNLTGGLRYAADKRFGVTTFSLFFADGTLVPGSYGPVNSSKTFRSVTGNVVASLKLAPDVLTYASFSTGTKQGGFTPGATPESATIPYKEQEVKAYEIGFKSRLADIVGLNIAGFYNDYKNVQVQQTLPTSPPISITTNAAKARAYGVDVDFKVDLTENFQFDVLYTYLNARIKDYQYSPTIYLSDLPQSRSPKHSGRIGATYRGPLFGNELSLNGNVQFKTKFTNDLVATSPTNVFLAESPGYHTFNMAASYELDTFTISAYVKNIANKQYVVAQAIFTPTAYYNVVPGEPRTFEVSITKRF